MKKTSIFIVIILSFLALSGCKQAQVKQSKGQMATPESNKTETSSEVKVVPVNKSTDGTYKGASTAGACEFAFDVGIAGGAVKGSGVGTGKEGITCNVTLNGVADDQGNMEGQATGAYTLTSEDTVFEWYLSGPFSGTLKDGDGNLTIELQGTGHKCPENIPCSDDPDTITVKF